MGVVWRELLNGADRRTYRDITRLDVTLTPDGVDPLR